MKLYSLPLRCLQRVLRAQKELLILGGVGISGSYDTEPQKAMGLLLYLVCGCIQTLDRYSLIEPVQITTSKPRLKPVESQRGLNATTLEYLKPEVVLSEQSRKSFIEKFKARKTTNDLDKKVNQAAVLVPLCKHAGELGFLYTLRSTKLTSNRGQVSFPGGMYDDDDRNLEETAIRETWEELNIPKEKIDIWASGNMINKKDLHVLPVFGYIGEVDPKNLQINTNEVEEAFFLSLKSLCELSLCRHTQFRNNYTMPVYLGGKHRVWGFTAVVTHLVLNDLVPDAYKHKLVFIRPVLPRIKNKIKDNVRPL